MESKELNKNNIYNSLMTITNIVFPIITFPYLTRVLGVDNIGKYNFSTSIVSYFNLIATLGISAYAIRECARVKNNRQHMSDLASDIFSIDVYSTIAAYMLLALTLVFSSKLKDYSSYILLLSTSFFINTFGMAWVCSAVSDFRFLSLKTVAFHFISFITLFLFVKNEKHLYVYILINVLCNLSSNFISFIYARRYADIKFKLIPNVKRHLKKIILLFSQTISILLYTNADMIMLGYYFNDETVGIYAIAVKIYNVVNATIASVINVATPKLSLDYDRKDFSSFNENITYVVNYILLLFLPAFVGINIMANEIIMLVSGRPIIGSVISLHILTISLMFSLISAVIGLGIIFPMRLDRVNFNSCVISAVTNIVLNIYFVPKFSFVGAALTTVIAEFVGFLNKIKYIDKNIRVYNFRRSLGRYFTGSIFVVIICILSKLFIGSNILRVMIAISFSIIMYFCYLMVIGDEFFANLVKPILESINKRLGNVK